MLKQKMNDVYHFKSLSFYHSVLVNVFTFHIAMSH